MNIEFSRGVVHVDNMRFCFYEVNPDGCKDLQPGSHEVEARYAHAFGRVLPHIADCGFVGDDSRCAIVLGRVRSRTGLIPDSHMVERLVACIETCAEIGTPVLVEIK